MIKARNAFTFRDKAVKCSRNDHFVGVGREDSIVDYWWMQILNLKWSQTESKEEEEDDEEKGEEEEEVIRIRRTRA